MYNITLLRHAESRGNAAGQLQGQSDCSLTEAGIQQTKVIAKFFKSNNILFDKIISSPLKRAHQTAQAVSDSQNVSIAFDPNWSERSFGSLEGVEFSKVKEIEPVPDFFDPFKPVGDDGESLTDLFIRSNKAIQDLLCRPPGSYLVVTHGATLNMALYTILGLSPQNYGTGARFYFGNTAYINLTYNPNKRHWRILGFNNQYFLQNGHK